MLRSSRMLILSLCPTSRGVLRKLIGSWLSRGNLESAWLIGMAIWRKLRRLLRNCLRLLSATRCPATLTTIGQEEVYLSREKTPLTSALGLWTHRTQPERTAHANPTLSSRQPESSANRPESRIISTECRTPQRRIIMLQAKVPEATHTKCFLTLIHD